MKGKNLEENSLTNIYRKTYPHLRREILGDCESFGNASTILLTTKRQRES